MSEISTRLHELLDASQIDYEIIHHRPDIRARTTAEDTHTPPGEFAKTVFVWVDGAYALAVLPATHSVSTARLARALGAEEVRLATEWEMEDLCPDVEVGAAPPFGNLWELPTYVSPALAADETITFNAGTHEDAVRMRFADFERLVEPRTVSMARHESPAAD